MNPFYEAETISDLYLVSAIESVDSHLGEGYAKKNPSLVANMVSILAQEHQIVIKRNIDEDSVS